MDDGTSLAVLTMKFLRLYVSSLSKLVDSLDAMAADLLVSLAMWRMAMTVPGEVAMAATALNLWSRIN